MKNNYNYNYNWWDDPKNQEEVKRLSWWNHDENKEIVNIPIAVIKDSDDHYTASTNDLTEIFLGESLQGCASGKTKEKAIEHLFKIIRVTHEHSEECRLNYQRWVPFRKGPWTKIGGTWFAIFGFHIYFRYGKGMKGGAYIPFTKLNISTSSDWAVYKRLKKEQDVK